MTDSNTSNDQVKLPRATYGSPDRPLIIGGVQIPCYVLDDGRAVITHRGIQAALKLSQSGGIRRTSSLLEEFISKGLDCNDLSSCITNPIRFRGNVGSGANVLVYGYEATVLVDLCDVILTARDQGLLQAQQQDAAAQAYILLRAFAKVSIIALIHEVTGYQKQRPDGELQTTLQAILEQYIARDLLTWTKTFPDEFYRELFRLKGWPFDLSERRRWTPEVGRLTNDLIYERLAPGVLEELRRVSPRNDDGKLKNKYHQRLTEDVGHPQLREHIKLVINLMKAGDNWTSFYVGVGRVRPRYLEGGVADFVQPAIHPDQNPAHFLPFPDEDDPPAGPAT